MVDNINQEVHKELLSIHKKIRARVEKRLSYLSRIHIRGGDRLWAEMVFCLLTPQSKARNACNAVIELYKKDKLFSSDSEAIAKILKKHVRFHNTKSLNIIEAKKYFKNINKVIEEGKANTVELRNKLAKEIKGFGMKESSHFLRNIGFGDDIAILDRHILRVMDSLNIMPIGVGIKNSLTVKRYMEIENSLRNYAKKTKIKMDHIDFVFWFKATDDVYK